MLESKEQLFVYGTLKDPAIQQKVFGRIAEDTPDSLAGYRKSEIDIDGKKYPAIVPDSQTTVEGLTLSVTPEELKLIDLYETSEYSRIKVPLKSGHSAWVYVKN